MSFGDLDTSLEEERCFAVDAVRALRLQAAAAEQCEEAFVARAIQEAIYTFDRYAAGLYETTCEYGNPNRVAELREASRYRSVAITATGERVRAVVGTFFGDGKHDDAHASHHYNHHHNHLHRHSTTNDSAFAVDENGDELVGHSALFLAPTAAGSRSRLSRGTNARVVQADRQAQLGALHRRAVFLAEEVESARGVALQQRQREADAADAARARRKTLLARVAAAEAEHQALTAEAAEARAQYDAIVGALRSRLELISAQLDVTIAQNSGGGAADSNGSAGGLLSWGGALVDLAQGTQQLRAATDEAARLASTVSCDADARLEAMRAHLTEARSAGISVAVGVACGDKNESSNGGGLSVAVDPSLYLLSYSGPPFPSNVIPADEFQSNHNDVVRLHEKRGTRSRSPPVPVNGGSSSTNRSSVGIPSTFELLTKWPGIALEVERARQSLLPGVQRLGPTVSVALSDRSTHKTGMGDETTSQWRTPERHEGETTDAVATSVITPNKPAPSLVSPLMFKSDGSSFARAEDSEKWRQSTQQRFLEGDIRHRSETIRREMDRVRLDAQEGMATMRARSARGPVHHFN